MDSTFTQQITITPEMTAAQVGSGLMEVYATPMVVAFMENTACRLLETLEGDDHIAAEDTTVGVHIDVQHVKASPVGEQVTCTATLTAHESRRYMFSMVVTNAKGDTLATATHERVRVNRNRFMSKL